MKRTYIKRGDWHLVGRKRQKGDFLPIFGAIAKPLLVSAAGEIGGEVLNGIEKKYLGIKNQVKKEEEKDIDMPRANILLQRLHNLRGVQLPNGRVLFAKHERVHRHSIAPNQVRIARTNVQKIRPSRKRIGRFRLRNERKWRQQVGAGLNIATAIDIGKRAAGSKLAKMIIIYAIDYIPTAYKKIKNRITKKKVKAVMNTAVNNYLVNRGVELTGERFN